MREQRSWHADALAAVRAELASAGSARSSEIEAFVTALMRDVDRRLWRTRGGRGLAALAWRMFEFAHDRKSGLSLRVWNPPDTPGRTAIEAVQPDRAFLVDTTRLLLREEGLREECFVHPVLEIDRSGGGFALGRGARESVMYVEVAPRVAEPEKLEAELRSRLARLEAITDDHRRMVRLVREAEANVEFAGQFIPGAAERADKIRRFLGWLAAENFVFMGVRRYAAQYSGDGALRISLRPGSGLGSFRDDETSRFATPLEGAAIPEEIREQLADSRIILIGKSRIPSTVHRAGRLDRVLVKEHDESGRLSGFMVVCGLFTFRALRTPGSQIPLLYERLEAILAEKQAAPQSHRQKAIVTTFDQTPAEFLLASHPDACSRVIEDIIAAEGSDEPQLVLSVDANRRSMYAAVVMPRYRYRDELRGVVEGVLAAQFGPLHADSRTSFIEEDTALIHFFCTPVGPRLAEVAFEPLERAVREKIAAWIDRLAEALGERIGADAGLELAAFYEDAFSEPYRVDTHPRDAARDVLALEQLHGAGGTPQFAFYSEVDAPHDTLLDIVLAQPRLLSELLPIVDRFGIQVVDARRESVRAANRPAATLVALRVVTLGEQADLDALLPRLGDALRNVLEGRVADDALSALVLVAGLDWREVDCLRSYVAYYEQIQGTLTAAYLRETLLANPLATRLLLAYFRARLDPALPGDRGAREAAVRDEFERYRARIPSLNEDRALAGLFGLIDATVRTSFFAERTPYRLSLKLDATRVAELETPRPYREIVVTGAGFFGIHIRGGAIARGGIRYSDRPGDLRTEVLGLMRTQMLKNGIIVPVGAKGGFVVSPAPTSPAEARARGDAKYREFIAGLLDVTDDVGKRGEIVPPASVHRRDGDDPYLVVAADKGTAHLSDTANAVARERGFWLDDAFASGGSAGYDHKKFAITARGAWECARHHFAELGLDPDTSSYSAVGIGDMSGDVFGNGFVLMRRVRLLAAFDHRHVFLDPDPDPERSWQERKRLYDLPSSTWADYDGARISKGGGVYRRDASRIALSPAARAMLGIEHAAASGEEVIRAALRMRVDLLWNGGIGTYVKSSEESHADVHDRANDAVRVDGRELRARVVAEGGNLGFTQDARGEAAASGVRIEMDSIDNSAGVDLSDHEVNLKIALAPLLASGALSREQRDALLLELAEESCERVLAHNRAQALVLSLDERRARLDREGFAWATEFLCKAEGMSPAQGKLPDAATLEARGGALLRPELAWLLGLAKLQLGRALLAAPSWELPAFAAELYGAYFPQQLASRHPAALAQHRLRREIGAMVTTNRLIDTGGVALIPLLCRELETDSHVVANALLLAHEILADLDFRERVLASAAEREAVYDALLVQDRALRSVARLLVRRRITDPAPEQVARWRAGLAELRALRADLPAHSALTRGDDVRARFAARGMDDELAREVASASVADHGVSMLLVSEGARASLAAAAIAYTTLGERTGLNWAYERIARAWPSDPWDRVELELLRGELLDLHAELCGQVLHAGASDTTAAVAQFLAERSALLARIDELQKRALSSDRPSALAAVTKAMQRLRGR
ncbi:MAG: NAD-glutamate dehydrogenase domain-containing protein [Myxococcota bacterium]